VKNISLTDVTTAGSSILTALKAEAPSQVQGAERQPKSVKKADRPTFNLTLLHGDIIVLYGEDFEVRPTAHASRSEINFDYAVFD